MQDSFPLRKCCPALHRESKGIGRLSLNTAGTVAAGELSNLRNRNQVVVAFDGVLECGCRNSKLNRILRGLAGQQGVNQAAAKAVAAADAVGDVQVILLGETVVLTVVQH